MRESNYSVEESYFLRNTVKDKLAELNDKRQKQASNSDLVATILLEDELSIAEAAWAKLKATL